MRCRPARTAYGRLPEWPKGAVCKTVGTAYVGSNPTPATTRNTSSGTHVAPDSYPGYAARCQQKRPDAAHRGIYAGSIPPRWARYKAAPLAGPLARRQRRPPALRRPRPAHAGPHPHGRLIKQAHTVKHTGAGACQLPRGRLTRRPLIRGAGSYEENGRGEGSGQAQRQAADADSHDQSAHQAADHRRATAAGAESAVESVTCSVGQRLLAEIAACSFCLACAIVP